MKYINTFCKDVPVSQIALGCMRMGAMSQSEAERYVKCALEMGYNYFDHADIYGGDGRCETVFGHVLRADKGLRDKMVLQTKCGIGKGMYDFSEKHIIEAVEGSLRRLGVEHIDVLLLHRPDLLMEPEAVAAAFDKLEASGKVGAFGVSNHHPLQIELLQRTVRQRLCINQMQLGLGAAGMLAAGANVNVDNHEGVNRDGYLREYCRLKGITVQPWSPLRLWAVKESVLGNERLAELNTLMTEMASAYGITRAALAIAWLLRLPDNMQPIVGSTDLVHLAELAKAAEVTLTAADWYALYRAAGYRLP